MIGGKLFEINLRGFRRIYRIVLRRLLSIVSYLNVTMLDDKSFYIRFNKNFSLYVRDSRLVCRCKDKSMRSVDL